MSPWWSETILSAKRWLPVIHFLHLLWSLSKRMPMLHSPRLMESLIFLLSCHKICLIWIFHWSANSLFVKERFCQFGLGKIRWKESNKPIQSRHNMIEHKAHYILLFVFQTRKPQLTEGFEILPVSTESAINFLKIFQNKSTRRDCSKFQALLFIVDVNNRNKRLYELMKQIK